MNLTVASKTILITGTSSGFGKLTTSLLLSRGHTVIAGLRGGAKRLRETFPEETEKYSSRLIALDLHMEQSSSLEGAKDLIEKKLNGKLDVLINNAGYGLFGTLEDLTPEQLRYQFEVNFFGPVFLTRALLPSLRAAKGRVLTLSSIAGLHAFPYYGSYNSSKFAVEAMFEALHYELKPMGVQVGLIEPGAFRTDFNVRSKMMAEGASNPQSPYASRSKSFQEKLKSLSFRQGNPIRVAKLIVNLCEKKKIPVRSLIGADAWAIHIASRMVPDSLRVRLKDAAFNQIFFK
jgi:NAD(P)-dependent dehydrogenase (short-subunit alcohol dehydrogenase family)